MIATCHWFSHAEYCRALPVELERFAETIAQCDPDVVVPTCPDWSVARLAEHLGSVHLWAGEHVRRGAQQRIPGRELDYGEPSDPAGFPSWLRSQGARLIQTLQACDPDAPVWAWGADKHARFWARRMLHESTVHRADAEFALGTDPAIEDAVAVDGIDEFLDNLPHAVWSPAAELRGEGERVALRTPEAQWTIVLGPDGVFWTHDGGGADATVEGPAADVYLLAWGRRTVDQPGLLASGDPDLLKRWVEGTRL